MIRLPLLLLVFTYVVLGVGLIGCGGEEEDPEVINPDPDYISTICSLVNTVEGDQIVSSDAEMRLHYGVNPRWGCLPPVETSSGCMGFGTESSSPEPVFDFSGEDYTALREATVYLNDIQLVFSEEYSNLEGIDYTQEYAVFRFPDGLETYPQPGDSVHWSIDVDSDLYIAEYDGISDFQLGDFGMPELPEEGTIVQPGDSLGLRVPSPKVGAYRLFLFENRELTDFVTYLYYDRNNYGINYDAWEYLVVPASVTQDTLWLQCRQENSTGGGYEVYYQWVRTILVDHN